MKYLLAVRYGAMGYIGNFCTAVEGLRNGDSVVVKSERGTELGSAVSSVEELHEGFHIQTSGEVLRVQTPQDEEEAKRIESVLQPAELKFCGEKVKELKLPMNLAAVEHLLGGEKIIFYFLAEGRVDFRQLVKELAKNYRTRIEMRQIGVRDEARLLGDVEHCGREICCRTFMKNLEPITMKMAKSQKTTLDPSKISGRCGRLMCCLRFEDQTYDELRTQLPKKGARVVTARGMGEVVSYDVIQQLVTIETDKSKQITVPVSEIVRLEGERPRDENEPG